MAVWNPRANEIFASVLELPAEQRQAHLDQACAGDNELKRQVEALLAAHGQAGSFLDPPANPADIPTLAPRQAASIRCWGSCVTLAITRSWASWAAAAWASSTRRGRPASTAWSPSR